MKRFSFVFAVLVVVVGFTGILAAQGTAPTQAKQTQQDEFLNGAYASTTQGLTMPNPTKRVHPKYTPDAMRMKLQGDVTVQIVVGTNGTVDRARVTKSLSPDTGLDAAALEAAKQWTFEPGKLKDKAVPVATEIVLNFRLH